MDEQVHSRLGGATALELVRLDMAQVDECSRLLDTRDSSLVERLELSTDETSLEAAEHIGRYLDRCPKLQLVWIYKKKFGWAGEAAAENDQERNNHHVKVVDIILGWLAKKTHESLHKVEVQLPPSADTLKAFWSGSYAAHGLSMHINSMIRQPGNSMSFTSTKGQAFEVLCGRSLGRLIAAAFELPSTTLNLTTAMEGQQLQATLETVALACREGTPPPMLSLNSIMETPWNVGPFLAAMSRSQGVRNLSLSGFAIEQQPSTTTIANDAVSQLDTVILKNVVLHDGAAGAFAGFKQLRELCFVRCNEDRLTGQGIGLGPLLRGSPQLERIDFTQNPASGGLLWREIALCLPEHCGFRKLSLGADARSQFCLFRELAQVLPRCMGSPLEEMTLTLASGVCYCDVVGFFRACEKVPNLRLITFASPLKIAHRPSACAIVQSLKRNTTLFALNGLQFAGDCSRLSPHLEFWPTLNERGRRIQSDGAIPLGCWAPVLARTSLEPSIVYYLLRKYPHAVEAGIGGVKRDETA